MCKGWVARGKEGRKKVRGRGLSEGRKGKEREWKRKLSKVREGEGGLREKWEDE